MMTRRKLFLGAGGAALIGGLNRAAVAAAKPALKIGVATLGFKELSNAELAKELASTGVRLIQLFLNQTDSRYWAYNGRSDVSGLTAARCREIAAPYRDAGIEIHSIGVYTNLIHPDDAERAANLDYFDAMMAVGGHMGVRTFITEAGHFHDPKAPAPRIAIEFQDETWPRTVGAVRQLAALAENHDAKVLLEPFYRGFLASAKRVRTLLEEVDSPRIRALLDPANLIELNDLDEMFAQLGPWIDCLHAKDRKLHVERGVAAGLGDVDYKRFVTLAAERAPHAPLVLEYVGLKDYKDALAHLRAAMRDAGVPLPPGLDSLSLAPTLLGKPEDQKRHEVLYWEYQAAGTSQAVLLDGRWKGIRNRRRDAPVEVYDLSADPGETRDLAESRPDLVARVQAAFESERAENPNWPLRDAPQAKN